MVKKQGYKKNSWEGGCGRGVGQNLKSWGGGRGRLYRGLHKIGG